jgi:hypothetical protein
MYDSWPWPWPPFVAICNQLTGRVIEKGGMWEGQLWRKTENSYLTCLGWEQIN